MTKIHNDCGCWTDFDEGRIFVCEYHFDRLMEDPHLIRFLKSDEVDIKRIEYINGIATIRARDNDTS